MQNHVNFNLNTAVEMRKILFKITPRTRIVGGQCPCDYTLHGRKHTIIAFIWHNHRGTVRLLFVRKH